MSPTERVRRSFIWAILAVAISTGLVLLVAFLGNAVLGNAGTSVMDIVSYVLGFPLVPGWLVSMSIFGMPGSCAMPSQILGVFLIPVFSVPLDTGMIFALWQFLHGKVARELNGDGILHIDG